MVIDFKDAANLPINVQKAIKSAVRYFKDYGGYLNEKGEHVINLFSPVIGPHYGVNLLLGNREELDEPLLTTPKSVVDQFGGGSFRGPSAQQVLATRWDMLPEENGSPFNRQFYLLENGKQIFYSHDITVNVKKAYCIHKVNQSEIIYETKDGLSIKRIIYLRKQHKEEEPIALERQVVEIKNNSSKPRNLKIVFTGMFGSANPGCQMVDVIYQTVINQTGLLQKDNKKIAIYPDYYPEYAREYIRFFSLGNGGFDNFSYDVSNFLGNGNINKPQNINFLGNELKVKGPSFFAVDKAFLLQPIENKTIVTSTGLVVGKYDLEKSISSILTGDYQKELQENEDDFNNYSSYLQLHTRNKIFNAYVLYCENDSVEFINNNLFDREKAVEDLYEYAKIFKLFLNINIYPNESGEYNYTIALLKELRDMDQTTAYPFLMRVIKDYKDNTIDIETLNNVINLIVVYFVRAVVCEVSSGSRRGYLLTMYKNIFGNVESNKQESNYYKAIYKLFFETQIAKKKFTKI